MDSNAGVELSVNKMVESATQSANGEAYQSVMRNEHYKAGIIVTVHNGGPPLFSIELLLRIFKPFSIIDLSSLEGATEAMRLLVGRGYVIAHEDDGWLCCRKALEHEKLILECELLRKILDGQYGDMRG